jgi:hypothetical protein
MDKPSSEPLKKQFLSHFLFNPHPTIVTLRYKLKTQETLMKGCIIDIETTGLNRENDKIIAFGILKRNIAEIHQLTKPDHDKFETFIKQKTQTSPKPRYGYAVHFEMQFLNFKDHKNWKDLTQYAQKDWDYYENPYYRLRLDQCTLTPFQEPDIQGSEVPQHWQQWLKTHKPQTLWAIAFHNLSDLLRTRQLIRGELAN